MLLLRLHSTLSRHLKLLPRLALMVLVLSAAGVPLASHAQQPAGAAGAEAATGPIRLRQASPELERAPAALLPAAAPPAPYVPGEFERFVKQQAGADVRRLGSNLVSGGEAQGDLSPLVPDDYVVAPGDEVLLNAWGSIDADLQLTVDRAGRITIPRIGAVQVAGVRYGDLKDLLTRRVGQQFKNFQLSVSLGQLRGIRVFVTGRVLRPGAYTVTSLSTVVSALMHAGGPSAAGSFRNIALSRNGRVISSFDLYDLLLKGDRSADRVVQAGDVVNVAAVGTQVAVIGSVNTPAVIEIKPNETVADVIRYAGGFSAVADRSRIAVERLRERNAGRIAELELPRDNTAPLSEGDVLRAFSAVDVALPTTKQSKRVKVEGELMHPAEYVLPEGSSVADAIRAAGGFTPAAYVFATELTRRSVQQTQQQNYERALRDLETDIARSQGSQHISSQDDAASQAARSAATSRLVERLRALKPSGRIVLQLAPDARELPNLALEDGDRIYVPPRPTTIGVFGSVFNAASYLYLPEHSLSDYLRLAGGATKGADEGSIFVVRANGNVVSGRQSSGWFNKRGDFDKLAAEPGDTIFVPEEMDKTTFVQAAKDWTQILYQFGIGLAGIKSAVR